MSNVASSAKYQIELAPGVYGVVEIKLSIPKNNHMIALGLGHSTEEQNNLVGQKLGEITQMLGYGLGFDGEI